MDPSVLQDFLSITGADEGVAINLLEATDWSLEEAVNLHFASVADAQPAAAQAQPAQASGANFGQGSSNPRDEIPPELLAEEDHVRAPIPSKRERLYGDVGMHGVPHGIASYGNQPRAAALDPGPGHVDVFRDFEAEAAAAQASSSAPRSQAAATAAGATAAKSAGLADLFKAPQHLLFVGSFEAAKAQALQAGQWLLVNVQTQNEFASHQLNRDTWGNELVQQVVKGMAVLWQVHDTAPEGQKVLGAYKWAALPVVAILDPITGAAVYERSGFIAPEELMEQLVPFMETGPNDPGASALAHNAYKRKAAAAVAGPSGRGSGPAAAMTEEEQLQMALAMSVEAAHGKAAKQARNGSVDMDVDLDDSGGCDDDDDDVDEEAIWAEIRRREQEEKEQAAAATRAAAAGPSVAAAGGSSKAAELEAPAAATAAVDVAAVQAAARGRLPPEPADGEEGRCRVGLRLPDGSRPMRAFRKSDKVSVLLDWVMSQVEEAAAGRPYQLSLGIPGSQPVGSQQADLTLEAVNAPNSAMMLRWL